MTERKIWKRLGKGSAINYPRSHPNVTCPGRSDTLVVTGFLGSDSWRVTVTKSFISRTRHPPRYALRPNHYAWNSISSIMCHVSCSHVSCNHVSCNHVSCIIYQVSCAMYHVSCIISWRIALGYLYSCRNTVIVLNFHPIPLRPARKGKAEAWFWVLF